MVNESLESRQGTYVKMVEQGVDGFNLDGILSELGSFGKYQLLLLLLLGFRDSFLNMCNFNYVFTAAEEPFRCLKPSCDINSTDSWILFPSNDTTCYRSDNTSLSCSFNTSGPKVVPCVEIIYDKYNSIVSEFDLGCQPWKATLIGTVHNLGLVFSFVLSGFISDRYGRKVIIVSTPLMVGIAGLLKSFAMDYWTLLGLEFLETALGYGNASMVLSLEAVSHKSRVVYSCISDILACLGGAFFGLIAWKVPYWRHLMRAIYAPLLVVVFYIFLMDEGVRWLLAHNKRDEAVQVLNKVAKINNITLSKNAQDMLSSISEPKTDLNKVEKAAEETPHIFTVLRSKTILLRMALIAACFICCSFVFSGAIINSVSISGSKYLNFSIMMLVQVPTRIITALTLTRFGRKAPICVAYCFCALFFMASAFVPKSIWWASVLFYIAGKMCSSYGIFSVQVVAMEIFPTTSRNCLTNVANTVGRLGSVLAPQTPLLEKVMPGLPSIVFALAALGPAFLALLLPDTSHTVLPDQVADAEKLDATKAEEVATESFKQRL
ncbi:unnamed protein product [Pieris brassicae]|uniref:Major facilitator superfamily (MFS) profile domain-containing protein n=2 Tax=Pieris brassicae TaxID=7116 RepID=A0A9P0TW72_PIEBR|nr:unnamed protein product [Pieris brassicae]